MDSSEHIQQRMVLGRRLNGVKPQHPPRICSFCDAQETRERIVFSGKHDAIYICADCVNLCHAVLASYASALV